MTASVSGWMPQHPGKGGLIATENPLKHALAGLVKAPVSLSIVRTQQPRAHHRRGGQRHQHRDHNGEGQRDGKLAKQAADDAAHHQDRDEDGHQRNADRDHREADFLGALQRRLQWRPCLVPDGG